jgi:peptidoglycan/LPS O-acetylase OafA/YrhL
MDELLEDGQLVHHQPAIDTLRYVLSWMAVLYNFYPWTVGGVAGRREGSTAQVASWGILACPTFFVLSGFCHSFNKLVGNKEEAEEPIDKPRNLLLAAAVRIMVWYPFYVLVLTSLAYYFMSYNAEDWSTYMAQLFLIGGAFLEHNQASYPYLPSSWWFSYLAVYLITWAPMHSILSTSGNSVVWTMFNMTFIAVFPSLLLEWCFMEDWAPFLFIQYLPSFFFGQALAVWQVRNCMQKKLPSSNATKPVFVMLPVQEIPLPVRFGVSFSIIILGCLLCLCSCYDRVPVFREYCLSFFLKGGLLPVFGMLIAGLACEADPLAKLVARKPLSRVGCLSLSQYMLALPVHIGVEHWTGNTGLSFAFAFALTAASVVGHFVVERPSRAFGKYVTRRVNLATEEGKS